jgi:hypothetical protein
MLVNIKTSTIVTLWLTFYTLLAPIAAQTVEIDLRVGDIAIAAVGASITEPAPG